MANPNHVLMPGMYVRAIIGEGAMPQGLLAPQRGITRNAKGDASALVVNNNGKVEVREVKVSRTIGDEWLVDSGLAAGDRVIVEGLQKVQPDMAVKAVEAARCGHPGRGHPGGRSRQRCECRSGRRRRRYR